MPQLFIWGLSISKAPLQASTSSSWASSGKPSRTRNSSSFHDPRRIFTLPARHCELNGPKRVSLSPLSGAGVTLKPLHIQQPIAVAAIAAELDADRPIRIVCLGFLGGREIPIADDVEIRPDLVDNRTPVPLEVQSGGGPDLPVAVEQPLALARRK